MIATSTVYDIFNRQARNSQSVRPGMINPMINKLKQFAGSLNGNPEQIVRSLLSSGRMSRAQFDTLSQQASQIQQMLNLNNYNIGGMSHV